MAEPSQQSSGAIEVDVGSSADSSTATGITAAQVGQFLLSKNLRLTALELLVEIEDVGLGDDVTLLKDFFYDTSKFDPTEVVKFQGEDVLSGQALAREREERLGSAEYDLRVLQEDNRELKEHLERVTTQNASAAACPETPLPPVRMKDASLGNQDTPSQRELHYMNGGVLAHLLHHGYRVTAMTLQEEAQGQIDSLSTRGNSGASSQPLWDHYRAVEGEKKAKEIAEMALKEQEKLQDRLDDLQRRYRAVQEEYETIYRENQMLRSDIQVLEEKFAAGKAEKNEDGGEQQKLQTSSSRSSRASLPELHPVPQTKNEDAANLQTRSSVGEGRFGVYGPEAALLVVASAIPSIVPNVLINKREDLVPVIIALVQEHPDSSERDKLCSLLFNLVKRPNEAQRKVISNGCLALAKAVGLRRTAQELLPHCWEQVSHKYAERRTLVANVMGVLVEHIEEDMRCSLVVSILEQLCADTDLEVRRSALISVISILDFISGLEKYRAFEELLLALTMDPSDAIAALAVKNLLPAVLNWVWESDKLYTELIPDILVRMLSILTSKPLAGGTEDAILLAIATESEMSVPTVGQQRKILSLIALYCKLLPILRAVALREKPKWAIAAHAEIGDSQVSSEALSYSASDMAIHKSGQMPDSEQSTMGQPHPTTGQEECADLQNGEMEAAQVGSDDCIPDKQVIQMEQKANEAPGLMVRTSSEGEHASHTIPTNKDQPEAVQDVVYSSSSSSKEPATPSDVSTSQTTPLAPTAEPARQKSVESSDNFPIGPKGDQKALEAISESEACEAFGRWIEASDHEEWSSVEIIARWVIPLLLCCIRTVSPVHECKKVRKRLTAAVKLTCGILGEAFTSRVIEPHFLSSAGIPTLPSPLSVPARIEEMAAQSKPQTPDAAHIGRTCILPVFLAGVLPQAGKGRLAAYVRILLMETANRGHTWVLQHKKDALAAMQFASLFPEANQQLMGLLSDSVKSPNVLVKRGAGVIAEALVVNLPPQEVLRTILPGIGVLSSFWDVTVQVAGVEAMESIAIHCANQPEVVSALHGQCDKLVSEGAHEVQIAVIRSLTAAVGASRTIHMEFLLKQILLVLARMHQKSTAGKSYLQLQETALTIFHALRTLDGCEIEAHNARLYLVAALESLQRESQLLDPTQRQLVSTMLRDRSNMTPSMQVPQMAQKPSVTPQKNEAKTQDGGNAD